MAGRARVARPARPRPVGVVPGLGPHAIYTVSGPLRWIAEVGGERGRRSRSTSRRPRRGERVRRGAREATGRLPRRARLPRPLTILAHGVWLDDVELELIAEGLDGGREPGGEHEARGGRALPYPGAAGPVSALGLGTDGVSSNSNLDMFEEVKLFALTQKHATGDPSTLPGNRGARDRARLARSGSGRAQPRRRRARRLPAPARFRSGAVGPAIRTLTSSTPRAARWSTRRLWRARC